MSAELTIGSSVGASAGARPADCNDSSGMTAISFSRFALLSWKRQSAGVI